MSGTLTQLMSQLAARELELSITSPVSTSVLKVWDYPPPRRASFADLPCIVNLWTPDEATFHSAMQGIDHEVNIRLLVYDADDDAAARIARAFYPEIVEMVSANQKFGLEGWLVTGLGAADSPAVHKFEEYSAVAAKTIIGLDLTLRLHQKYTVNHAAGSAPV